VPVFLRNGRRGLSNLRRRRLQVIGVVSSSMALRELPVVSHLVRSFRVGMISEERFNGACVSMNGGPMQRCGSTLQVQRRATLNRVRVPPELMDVSTLTRAVALGFAPLASSICRAWTQFFCAAITIGDPRSTSAPASSKSRNISMRRYSTAIITGV
jgi:hypothetical protein